MGTLLQISDLVREQLFAHQDILDGVVDSGSASTIVDATLISSLVTSRNYVGSYVYMDAFAAGSAGEYTRISAFGRSTGTLTLSPALSAATAAADTYQIHYGFHPNSIRTAIQRAAELGTRNAVAASDLAADTDSQGALPDEYIAEGALYFIRLQQSRNFSGDEREEALTLAQEHLENFRQMVRPHYGEIGFGDRSEPEPATDPLGRFS